MDNQGLDSNLLATPITTKKKQDDSSESTNIAPPKQHILLKNSLKYSFYVLLALFSFLLFLLLKIPTDAIGKNLLAYLSQNTAYTWDSEKTDVSLIFGPKISFTKLTLSNRYPPIGTVPQKILIEKISINPNLIQMIPIPGLKPFTPSVKFSAEAFQGTVTGSIKIGSSLSLEINGENIALEKITILKENFGIALKGKVSQLQLSFNAPQSKFSVSNASIKLQANALQFDPSSISAGMTIPEMNLGPMQAVALVKNGRLTIEKLTIGDSSRDLEILGDGQILLKDPIQFSDMDIHFRIKVSDIFSKAVPSIMGMLPIIAAKRPDGYFGTKISGSFMSPAMPVPYLGN